MKRVNFRNPEDKVLLPLPRLSCRGQSFLRVLSQRLREIHFLHHPLWSPRRSRTCRQLSAWISEFWLHYLEVEHRRLDNVSHQLLGIPSPSRNSHGRVCPNGRRLGRRTTCNRISSQLEVLHPERVIIEKRTTLRRHVGINIEARGQRWWAGATRIHKYRQCNIAWVHVHIQIL